MEIKQSTHLTWEEQTLANLDNLSKRIHEMQEADSLTRKEKDLLVSPFI